MTPPRAYSTHCLCLRYLSKYWETIFSQKWNFFYSSGSYKCCSFSQPFSLCGRIWYLWPQRAQRSQRLHWFCFACDCRIPLRQRYSTTYLLCQDKQRCRMGKEGLFRVNRCLFFGISPGVGRSGSGGKK